MRKLLLVMTLLSLLFSCSTTEKTENLQPAEETPPIEVEIGADNIQRPIWTDGSNLEEIQKAHPDYIFGVGKAKYSTERASIRSAASAASSNISEKIKDEIDSIYTELLNGREEEKEKAETYFIEEVRRLIKPILVDLTTFDTWQTEDGTFYVLAGCLEEESIKNTELVAQAKIKEIETYRKLLMLKAIENQENGIIQ